MANVPACAAQAAACHPSLLGVSERLVETRCPRLRHGSEASSLWDVFQCVGVCKELLSLSGHQERDAVDDNVLAPQAHAGHQ